MAPSVHLPCFYAWLKTMMSDISSVHCALSNGGLYIPIDDRENVKVGIFSLLMAPSIDLPCFYAWLKTVISDISENVINCG
ncbi:hypothetical protein P8452_45491 [Trifolium repens]|nr:hypothetical protein P8452_45491 [Trifolium repens]